MHFQVKNNDEDLRHNLYVIEEKHDQSNVRQAAYKSAVEGYYNQRVKEKASSIGDYVLRKNEKSHAQPQGKLGPTWERPYKATGAHRNGPYTLETIEGIPIPRI